MGKTLATAGQMGQVTTQGSKEGQPDMIKLRSLLKTDTALRSIPHVMALALPLLKPKAQALEDFKRRMGV